MAVIIVPLAVCVHSVLGWIFAVTLRPGVGGSTVFPIYFVVGAVYSGLGAMIVIVCAFRRFYHLERYIEVKHVVYLALMFLAADLTMIYLTVSDFMTPAYAAETLGTQYITSLTTGPYAPEFWFTIVAGFILPAIIVAVPKIKKGRLHCSGGDTRERGDVGGAVSHSRPLDGYTGASVSGWCLLTLVGGRFHHSSRFCGPRFAVDFVDAGSSLSFRCGSTTRLVRPRRGPLP